MNGQLEQIVDLINKSKNIAIFTHQKSDGDAFGSQLSLASVLKRMGKDVSCYAETEIAEHLENMHAEKIINKKPFSNFDLCIAVDCATFERLGIYGPVYAKCKNTINIDHHKDNEKYGKVNYIGTDVGSNCENMFELFELMIEEKMIDGLNEEECKFLLSGIMTDTGRFKFSSTNAKTLFIASKILAMGNFNVADITTDLFDSISMSKFNVNKLVYNKTEFFENNQLALTILSYEDLQSIDADYTKTQDVSQYILAVKSVKACVIVSGDKNGVFYVSFRSKGDFNVSHCASTFGGGGHKNASGCRLTGNIETVKEKLRKALRDEL